MASDIDRQNSSRQINGGFVFGKMWKFHWKKLGKMWETRPKIPGKMWEKHAKTFGKMWKYYGNVEI